MHIRIDGRVVYGGGYHTIVLIGFVCVVCWCARCDGGHGGVSVRVVAVLRLEKRLIQFKDRQVHLKKNIKNDISV